MDDVQTPVNPVVTEPLTVPAEPAPVVPVSPAPADVKDGGVTSTQSAPVKPIVDSSGVIKWEETQEHIAGLEKELNAKVVVLYVSMFSSLTEEDVDYLYDHLKNIGKCDRLAMFLYGPGGSGIAAARMVFLLRKYAKELWAVVPSNAASAMTMLTLGADKVLMGPLSALSPIDTSLASHPLAPKDAKGNPVRVEVTQIQKFIELLNSGMTSKTVDDVKKSPYALLTEHVHPVVVGTIQRMLSLSKMLTSDILRTHMDDMDRVAMIVNQLNDEFPTHGYPITYEKAMGLRIPAELMSDDLNTKALKFLKVLHFIAGGGESEREGTKVKFTRPTLIESMGVRTYYYSERKFVLDANKAWAFSGSNGKYMIMAPRKDERGIVRVKNVDSAELW